MEPIKLENQIKEKLNSRTIQPSAQAWDRLDAMLSVAEEKKTRPRFGFFLIAASILVFVSSGIFFFTQNSSKINNQNNVVGTAAKKDSTTKTPNQKVQFSIKEQNQTVVAISQPINQRVQNNNQRVSIINQNHLKQSTNPLINRDKEIEYQNNEDVALKDMPRIQYSKEISVGKNGINTKSDVTFNELSKLVQKKPTYIDVDALLASAENSSKSKILEKTNKINVDAKALLSQADQEVETTFREKAINRITKNYREVKVALSNRNQE